MAEFNGIDGIWRTVGGRHIFIKNGQDLASAMKESGKFPSAKGNEIVYNRTSSDGVKYAETTEPEKFQKKLEEAKNSVDKKDAWRVDSEHSLEDYKSCKMYITEDGGTIAIAPDGDIISVCKNQNGTTSGSKLLKIAIENGGNKLDSFSGNHTFYTKNGFEPVSRVEFDTNYAPTGWNLKIAEPEDVVFYKYTGKTNATVYEDVKDSIPLYDDYDEAMKIRDEAMNK